ncbi:YkvA family protein [Desmospora profundinema]|uniref:Uncharacterized membrane protein YkvA (DUF1232 family) n=1 Tax=Desmospora profundinema TaxID=1571184 RepID=A0ABU1IKI1_9BACL|nr:YkvA family protein [Desmospora profundinema]MDR6225263.1 uncharacterized membrane protein YkvA (DUF1232 family) [Desmospora profundinema]
MTSSAMENQVRERLKPLANQAVTPLGRKRILDGFNRKVKRVGGIGQVVEKLKVLYYYFRDPETSRWKKALAGAALLYFIMPIDVIPDYLPVVGYVDDGAAVVIVWRVLSKELERFTTRYASLPDK